METCGFAPSETLLDVMSVTDSFLFDLKHMDGGIHRGYTGQDNRQILRNAEMLIKDGADVLFRQPLVRGVNDSMTNIDETAGFLAGLGEKALRLQLMPYHRMGQSKYKALNATHNTDEFVVMDDSEIEAIRDAYVDRGIDCTISR
jgi:pyruvate formate lyase activating enzyme